MLYKSGSYFFNFISYQRDMIRFTISIQLQQLFLKSTIGYIRLTCMKTDIMISLKKNCESRTKII
jgi:hypothetical protein